MDHAIVDGISPFMPHGHCYHWTPSLVALLVGSDGLIAVAYFAIATMLVVVVRQRDDVPFPTVIWLFAAFILACGVTHAIAAVNTWTANYWLEGAFKGITAGISVATAVLLYPVLPQALALRSPAELAQANAALEAANAKLQTTNAELDARKEEAEAAAEKLARLNRALRDAREQERRIVETLSHELRTPLSSVTLSLLSVLDRQDVSADLRQPLERARRGAFELERLVGQLDAHVDSRAVDAAPMPTDLASVVRSAVEGLQRSARLVGMAVEVEVDEGVPAVHLDPVDIDQIVTQLVENSLQHAEDGTRVSVGVHWRDGLATITVADDGVGLPEEELDHVLQSFVRGAQSRARQVRGTGLGFTVVREASRRHDGTLSLRSNAQGGLTAEVTVKACRAASSDQPLATVAAVEKVVPGLAEVGVAASPSEEGRPTLLVVDDDDSIRLLLVGILSTVGTVVAHSTADEAWAWLQHHTPDIVVCDLVMPGLDGFGLTRRIRQDRRLALVPVVLITGRGDREARLEGWEAGADEFVVKPLLPREVQVRAQTLIDAHRMRQSSRDEQAVHKATQATNEELRRLAMALSHDLHGPLRSVDAALRMSREDLAEGLLEDADQLVSMSQRRVAHMADLSRALLDYCRTAWQDHDVEAVDVVALVRRSVAVVDDDSGPAVHTELPPSLSVIVPAVPFELVVRNLVSNARKHHDKGRDGRVDVALSMREDTVVIEVSDDGPGIPAELHDAIFSMFRRGASAAAGTGVGLSLVRTLVERHGGQITLDSEVGVGSTFTVYWPTLGAS